VVVVQATILEVVVLYYVIMPLAGAGPLRYAQSAGPAPDDPVGPHHVVVDVRVPPRLCVKVTSTVAVVMEVALLHDVMIGVVPVCGLEDYSVPPVSGDVHRVQPPGVVRFHVVERAVIAIGDDDVIVHAIPDGTVAHDEVRWIDEVERSDRLAGCRRAAHPVPADDLHIRARAGLAYDAVARAAGHHHAVSALQDGVVGQRYHGLYGARCLHPHLLLARPPRCQRIDGGLDDRGRVGSGGHHGAVAHTRGGVGAPALGDGDGGRRRGERHGMVRAPRPGGVR